MHEQCHVKSAQFSHFVSFVFYTPSPLPPLRVPFFPRLIGHNDLEAVREGDSHNLEDAVLNREKVVTVRLIIRSMEGAISGTIFFLRQP
jgi:hypothetical protein